MDSKLVEIALSPERLSTFVNLSKSKTLEEALILYGINLELSGVIYPLMSCLEVTLRNNLHKGMAKHWGEDWLINGRVEFLPEELSKIQKAQGSIRSFSIPKLVAELNFGFWTSLFSNRYSEEYTSKIFKDIFPNTRGVTLSRARGRLNDIRKQLRNRLFHFEPVINLSTPDIFTLVQQGKECLSWMNPDTLEWLDDNFNDLKDFNNRFSHLRDYI